MHAEMYKLDERHGGAELGRLEIRDVVIVYRLDGLNRQGWG